ncbi:MAG: NAD(P)/FAD-dependent oxidoreductase [Myxococcota bacterium]
MPHKVRTVIVGCGFGGVAAAYGLQQIGQDDFVILERGAEVGGVWAANTYPGIACDVPSHAYSLSFAPNPRWSRRFSPGPEIQQYLIDLTQRLGLEQHLRLNAEVRRAVFDDASQRWRIELRDGETLDAEVVISACGQLSRPTVPPLPGLERFRGDWFHSAEWPEGKALDGARVAVVGTGASAIQIVPSVASAVDHMTVFQRSAPWVIPKFDTEYSRVAHWLYSRFPRLQRVARWFWRSQLESLVPAFTRQPPLTSRVMVRFFTGLVAVQRFLQLRGNRRLMEATTPDYPLGCKRVALTNQWYPTLRRDNVALCTSPIREIVEDGVLTTDGAHHAADTIVFATGFTATEFLAPMEVRGRSGLSIRDAWSAGAEAFLGITVPGFPNFFMLYGPNTNHGTGSALELIEVQARYAAQAVALLANDEAKQLEVRPEVHDAFCRELDERLAGTVWANCSSWYVTESGRVTNQWPGTQNEYRERAGRLNVSDYVTDAPRRAVPLSAPPPAS